MLPARVAAARASSSRKVGVHALDANQHRALLHRLADVDRRRDDAPRRFRRDVRRLVGLKTSGCFDGHRFVPSHRRRDPDRDRTARLRGRQRITPPRPQPVATLVAASSTEPITALETEKASRLGNHSGHRSESYSSRVGALVWGQPSRPGAIDESTCGTHEWSHTKLNDGERPVFTARRADELNHARG